MLYYWRISGGFVATYTQLVATNFTLGVTLRWIGILYRGKWKYSYSLHVRYRNWDNLSHDGPFGSYEDLLLENKEILNLLRLV